MTNKIFLRNQAVNEAKIHPIVLFQIFDRFLRRMEGQERVIGTLLGTIDNDYVEITNCFPVPHLEKGEEVAVGKDFNKQMYALHQRVNPKEQVVGWYATSTNCLGINEHSCLIHDFYGSECETPIHLVVDTSLKFDSISVQAFISTPLALADRALANQFKQIKVDVHTFEAESVALDVMIKNRESSWNEYSQGISTIPSEIDVLERAMTKLLGMIEAISDYVQETLDGKRTPDESVAREISCALATVPKIQVDVFDRIFNNSLQDLLMVSYLSNLTQAQLVISEKLSNCTSI